jgi:hypothetical protein
MYTMQFSSVFMVLQNDEYVLILILIIIEFLFYSNSDQLWQHPNQEKHGYIDDTTRGKNQFKYKLSLVWSKFTFENMKISISHILPKYYFFIYKY